MRLSITSEFPFLTFATVSDVYDPVGEKMITVRERKYELKRVVAEEVLSMGTVMVPDVARFVTDYATSYDINEEEGSVRVFVAASRNTEIKEAGILEY